MSAQRPSPPPNGVHRAAALKPRSQVFIDGQFAPAASGATFDNLNPATGKSLGPVASGDAADIDRAVASARAAFRQATGRTCRPRRARRC